MSGPRIVLPNGSWGLREEVAESLLGRLQEAAESGRTERVPVLAEDGSDAELLVAPAVVPVVVVGAPERAPETGFPERGDIKVPDLPDPL